MTLSDLTLGVSDVVVQAEQPANAPARGYMELNNHVCIAKREKAGVRTERICE
jgi:hypothetical protein